MRCNLPACIWCKSSLGCTAFITPCCLTATPIRGLKGKRQIIQTTAKDILTFSALDDRSWRCRDDMDVLVAVYTDQHNSLHHSYNEEAELCFRRLRHCLVQMCSIYVWKRSLALPRKQRVYIEEKEGLVTFRICNNVNLRLKSYLFLACFWFTKIAHIKIICL